MSEIPPPGDRAEDTAVEPGTHIHPSEGGSENPAVQHERSDVSLRGPVAFGLALVVSAVVLHVGLWLLLEYYASREARQKLPPPPVAREQHQHPIEDRIQSIP